MDFPNPCYRCSDETHQILRQTVHHDIQKNGILATRLCTHKEDVNKINQYHLEKLQGRFDVISLSKIQTLLALLQANLVTGQINYTNMEFVPFNYCHIVYKMMELKSNSSNRIS